MIRIIVAIIIAVLCWWVTVQLAPPEPIGKVIRVLIVCVFILWLLSDMGLLGSRLQIS